MDLLQNVTEYYEELFPISVQEKSFFNDLLASYTMPARFLRIGCGTGLLESSIAKLGHDVTGIDTISPFLDSANLRRRTPDNAIRFFEMSTLEMVRFLGKGFYNIIACLNSRIIFIHDKILLRKFFYDCRQLLSTKGTLVLELANFNKIPHNKDYVFYFPTIESIRVSYFSHIKISVEGDNLYSSTLEHHKERHSPVIENEKVYPITLTDIKDFATEAGFNNIECFSNFELDPFTDDSPNLVCRLS